MTTPLTGRQAAICLALSLTLIGPGQASAGSLDDTLGGVFDNVMSNTTDAGRYDTMRRGVITGGRFSARTKITRANLMYFDPPSMSAGCGGIDLFGGSFSFINKDQLIQLARATAQNAVGLLFESALKVMSPQLADSVTKFLAKIQAMNDSMLDSCEMARGIVTKGPITALTETANAGAELLSSIGGATTDMFDATQTDVKNLWKGVAYDNPTGAAETGSNSNAAKDRLGGNILWRAMRELDVEPEMGGDTEEYREQILSATGFIVFDIDKAADNDTEPTPHILPPTLSLTDLVEGGTVTVYACDTDDNCYEPTLKEVTLEGMQTRIEELVLGTGSTTGLIANIRLGNDAAVAEGKALLSFPTGVGGIVSQLAEKSEGMAETYVRENASALALAVAYGMMTEYLETARTATANSSHDFQEALSKQLDTAMEKLNADYKVARDQYGSITQLLERGEMSLRLASFNDDGMSSHPTPNR